jgi:hypothetical protein
MHSRLEHRAYSVDIKNADIGRLRTDRSVISHSLSYIVHSFRYAVHFSDPQSIILYCIVL